MWGNGQLKERILLGRKCWGPEMKKQKKDVWKLTGNKRERLKSVYIKAKGSLMNSLEGR